MLARGPSRHTVETLRLHWNLPSCSIVSAMKWRMETTGFSGWIPQAIVGKAGMRHRRSGFSGFSESNMVNRALLGTPVLNQMKQAIAILTSVLLLAIECNQKPEAIADNVFGKGGQARWVEVAEGRLKTEIYTSAQLSAHPTLIVVLHGDLPTPRPSYQYALAQVVT